MDSRMGAAPPSGRVALLFSDIEGSTALLGRLGAGYEDVLDAHDLIMRAAFAEHGGYEFSNEGDAFGAAFGDPGAAAAAAVAIQRRIAAHAWPAGERVRVRMGLHYGEPKMRGDDYWGEDVHYAARICGAAHGGQVLLSAALRVTLGPGAAVSLGHHGLKDFATPRELFQLVDGQVEDFPPPRTLSVFRTNLPSIATPLFGRDDVLDSLERELTAGARLVTLLGAGGMGKTRVAVALGERVAHRFADGVAFVALAGVGPDQVDAAVAEATGAPRRDDDAVDVLTHLERRRMLVVLDNCEHVPDEAAALAAAVLARSPGVALLATSQLPLALTSETLRRLPPLAVTPDETHQEAAAVQMFVARARARDPSFGPAADERARVREVCELLDGMPLAIELAAARVRLTGIDRLLESLRAGLDHLGAGSRDIPERQRSLRAALDWTVSLLSDSERRVFAALAAFASAYSLEQAELMFAGELDPVEVWEVLSRLLDASLVVERGDGRFAMPERVRRHATEVLSASAYEHAYRRRHAEVVGAEIAELHREMFIDHHRHLANLVDLMPEARQAIAWTRGHAPDTYHRLALDIAPALAEIVDLGLVADHLDTVGLPPPDAHGSDVASVCVAIALLHQMRRYGDAHSRAALWDRAVDELENVGDHRLAVFARCRAIALLDNAQDGSTLERRHAELRACAARLTDPRWLQEATRVALFTESVDDHRSIELAREVIRTTGTGTGLFAWMYPFAVSADLVTLGDWHGAASTIAAALRITPREHIQAMLSLLMTLGVVLAETGHDAAAVELRSGIDAVSRARIGHAFDLTLESWGRALAAAELRLGEESAAIVRRGQGMSYDEVVDRGVVLADELRSSALEQHP